MNLTLRALDAAERLPVPDSAIRAGIKQVIDARREGASPVDPDADCAFALSMDEQPATKPGAPGDARHREVPSRFFELCLGPRRKPSCCYYERAGSTLSQAEERALALTCEHASLENGQRILELGCGWGALTLYMAEHYPRATIRAVAGSQREREAIEALARRRDIRNVAVDVAGAAEFDTQARYDRIVSVELFEHVAKWRPLLARSSHWLNVGGLTFIHVCTHVDGSYRFDRDNEADWIAQHFFTGELMPSRTLIEQFGDIYSIDEVWEWDGRHYARTARDWLARFDARRDEIMPILTTSYGEDAKLWLRRWRLYFLATEGLFGYEEGQVWGVTHYRLKPVKGSATPA